jgi:hypothetical protein
MNNFVEGHDALQQSGHDASLFRNLLVEVGVLDVRALKNIFGVTEAQLVADRGNIAGNGTVSERNDIPCALANFVGRLEVLLVADSAFHEASIDIVRVFFDIHDGAENEVDLLCEFEKRLVEIEK